MDAKFRGKSVLRKKKKIGVITIFLKQFFVVDICDIWNKKSYIKSPAWVFFLIKYT